MVYNEEQKITFLYTNWKGVTSIRTAVPVRTFYGTNDFHEGRQWFLEAWDLDKKQLRCFALQDCNFTTTEA